VQTTFDLARLRDAVGAGSAEAVAFSEEVNRSLDGARIDTPQALNEHVMPILARHFPKLGIRVYGSCVEPLAWVLHLACTVFLDMFLGTGVFLLAENAYRRGDQKGLFEVMRRLAPKQRKAKVQLRGDDGRILSNAEELSVFTEYCRGLFSQGQCVATSILLGQPFRLEAVALEQHMCKLSIYKSVPAHTLPPAVWKLCRQALAPLLVQFADKAWQLRPSAPSLWCDSWLVWLNKVGKQGRSPDELRPIALQDTGGKIVTKHLASLL
ncbi:unnamed protein product, partial [Symbiodinium necroappetens]